MRMSVRTIAAGLAALALGLTAFARPTEDKASPVVTKAVLPAEAAAQAIADDIKLVQTILADKMDKKATTKARVVAMFIALTAQTAGEGKSAEQATLRDQALAVAEALSKDDIAGAKKLAAELAVKPTAAAGVKTDPVALNAQLDIADLMTVFKMSRAGGQDLEKILPGMMKKPDMKLAPGYAAKLALVAVYTESMPPAPMGGKLPADWVKYSQEMKAAALDAHTAAKAGKDADVKAAFKKIDIACNACHEKFRQ